MTAVLEPQASRIIIAIVLATVAIAVALLLGREAGWQPAVPLVPIVATPLVPALPIAMGISTDDVLPAVGIVLGLLLLDWRDALRIGWPRVLVAGAVLMIAAGIVASVAAATSISSLVTMGLKGTGHVVFLALVGTVVVATVPSDRRRGFLAAAIAAVATFEASFGVVAWLVPLPDGAGLEATRGMTSLLGLVPGRIAGTTGLSPNFLGALFVLSIPLTAAIALDAPSRSTRLGWWVATALQLAALALTFTRTSLVIGVGILVVLLLLRGHVRMLAVLGLLVVVLVVATPLGARLVGDANDRAALWTSAVRMLEDNPVTGVGPGRTQIVADANPGRYRTTDHGVATNNAHNTILLAAAETGVFGALGALLVNLSLASLGLAALLGAIRPRGLPGAPGSGPQQVLVAAAGLGVLGFLVQGMTNNLFAVQVTSVWAMVVVAGFLVPPSVSIRDWLGIGPRTDGRTVLALPGYGGRRRAPRKSR